MKQIQPGIYEKGQKLYTKASSTQKVYGEKFIEEDGEKYREWNPNRSKAGAAVKKGVNLELGLDSDVLYLGAASGTTVSHFSDILEEGFVFALEYSDTVIRKLVEVAESRKNIAPILGNARNPDEYEDLVTQVDAVFQDISQSDQAEIFTKNAEKYLKKDGVALLAVKAQSISTSRPAEEIFDEVKEKLKAKFEIKEETLLDPYETDHLFLKMKLK
ncbi:fibrillarin-like rRNA/tRNA 2'-O-methyltransferase [Candidatus Nanosalina sp. VS9-1]|uniref:fibrillarin-like rRNA/tRNA 2'-O-methyltransferase n=1 Tax=Candidatus Nanosalina sp. VS9-1 TaxID=3388566 RepID=UPI0039E1A4AD